MKNIITVIMAAILFQNDAYAESMKSLTYKNHRCNRVAQKKRDAIGKIKGSDIVIGTLSLSNKSATLSNELLTKAVANEMSQYPLVSSDSAVGLFITDWMPVGNLNMRQKISTSITDPDKGKLIVRVFRQIKDKSGDWISIDNDEHLEKKIHNSIISKSKR